MKTGTFSLVLLLFISCTDLKQKEITSLLQKWDQREIFFPKNMTFNILGKDTIFSPLDTDFKIVSFVDSTGCTNCKLRLNEWRQFISYVDSFYPHKNKVFFFIHPKDTKEIEYLLMRNKFDYPICIDIDNSFNRLNHLPDAEQFQTFLLDKKNKVIAIGNPIRNTKVKKLYLRIFQDEKVKLEVENSTIKTRVNIDKTYTSLGNFDWKEEQRTTFVLKNTGNKPLVIEDINTSCGCTSVDYLKEPTQPGKEITLNVTYKADHPEHFNKTITVYCNAETSPIILKISGDAK